MAVEIGTAANARDLVSKLEKFLTTNPELVQADQAWTVIKDSDGGDEPVDVDETYEINDDERYGWSYRMRFIGHGLDGQDTIVVPMAIYVNTQYKVTSLCAWYANQNDSDKDISTYFAKPRLKNIYTSIPLHDEPMNYWFVANGRRFIIVAKVKQYYLSMYCGFMLQFGTDLENPYPVYIGGSHNNNYARIVDEEEDSPHQRIDFDYGGFHDPLSIDNTAGSQSDTSSCFCNTPDSILAMITQGYGGVDTEQDFHKYSEGLLLPYGYRMENEVSYDRTVRGKYILSPIEIFVIPRDETSVGFTIGWLHGAYFVSGWDNVPEKELLIDGKRYLCFPSMKNRKNGWFALLME